MAGECADDDDAKATINELRNAVLDELKMHNSVVQVKSAHLEHPIALTIQKQSCIKVEFPI